MACASCIKNQSLGLEGMYILSSLNKAIPKIVDGEINKARLDLAACISSHFSCGHMYYSSTDEINDFESRF